MLFFRFSIVLRNHVAVDNVIQLMMQNPFNKSMRIPNIVTRTGMVDSSVREKLIFVPCG